MTHDMYQVPDQPHASADSDQPARSNRRGQNLSLADRARGGHNSAKQQRRDGGGRFAGAKKSDKPAAATNEASNGSVKDKEMAWR